MSQPCRNCTHDRFEHENGNGAGDGCFSAVAGGRAAPCSCDACDDAQRLYDYAPRCGCRMFVAPHGGRP